MAEFIQESIAFLVCVQCRRKESSRSLSHLLMSFLYDIAVGDDKPVLFTATDTGEDNAQNAKKRGHFARNSILLSSLDIFKQSWC